MNSADTTHDRVLQAVAADLRPVRAVRSPLARAAALAPVAALLTFLAISSYGRRDLAQLGAAIAWGLSAAQWMVGLAVMGVALREATPGSALSRRTVWAGALAILALLVTTTWVTYAVHPTHMPPHRALLLSYLCFVGPLKLGLPLVMLATLLASRAFPTTPARVGALCGLGAGLMMDSGWRLTCWITAPAHVLGAHLAAVLALGACGALMGIGFDRLRRLTD